MLQSICKNLQTLYRAVGNEPVGQIVRNAIRKAVGKKAVLERKELPYNLYLQQQHTRLHKRQMSGIQSEKISIILIDDGSKGDNLDVSVKSILKQRLQPKKILLVSDKTSFWLPNIDIYKSLNEAAINATSEYLCIAGSKHFFHTCFLQELGAYINKNKVDILHTCYDQIVDGEQSNPSWLPQLNQHLLYSTNYIGDCFLVNRSLGIQLNWFATESFKETYIYDFYLRAIDARASFCCLPDVLYSYIGGKSNEPIEERKRVLNKHLERINLKGEVIKGVVTDTLRVKWNVEQQDLVSIIISFRDKVELLRECVDSILKKTDYPNYEIILADNRSKEEETKEYIERSMNSDKRIKYVSVDMEFNFSAINNYAATKCNGEYLLFLNNDTKVISSDWLSEMVTEIQGPKVGIVGAKLLYADNTVQHAGVLYGVGHVAGHAFRHLPDDNNGHMDRANLVQEYLAVTGACLLIKKLLFYSVNGFDEVNLAIAYNDVDLCLRVNELGYKIIFSPYAKLFHYESKSREYDLSEKERNRYENECDFMRKNWDSNFASKINHIFFEESVIIS